MSVLAPQGCEIVGCAGEGIDTSTGAYTVQESDLAFPSGVYGVEFKRSYRSDRTTSGWLGQGWATVYDTTLKAQGSGLVLDAPLGLAPLWRPEAPTHWSVSGGPTIGRTSSGAEVAWPTGERWAFDVDGNLLLMSSPYGQMVSIERAAGIPTVIRSSQGPTITLTNQNGLVSGASTNDGRTVTFDYKNGVLSAVSAPGAESSYAYNADVLMVQTSNAAGVTKVGYSNNTVADQVPPSGPRLSITYDKGTTTVTGNETLVYEHDDERRLVRALSGENEISVREFDESGRLTEATDYVQPGQQVLRSIKRTYKKQRLTSETVNGLKSSIEYDDLGRVESVTTGSDVSEFEYTSNAPLPTAVTSPTRGRDTIVYTNGFVTRVVDATGMATSTGRDSLGSPINHAVGNQSPWTYTFDAEGNITSTVSPSGRIWASTWEPRSRLIGERDPLGRASHYRYDTAGHLIEEALPGKQPRALDYSGDGRLEQETGPDGQTIRYEYDASGRLAATILPGDRVWRTATEPQADGGNSITVTAPDGVYTVTRLDSIGRELERHSYEADGTLVETLVQSFVFDLPLTTVVTRDASRLESTIDYDDSGRAIGKVETLDGRPTSSTQYTFENGRMTTASNGNETAIYAYDAAGRLISVTSGADTWQATYRAGQLTSTLHNGTKTSVSYDLDGRANTFVDAAGTTTTWTFDSADRPVSRSVGESIATFGWTPDGHLARYHAPDGSQWTWAYDGVGRLLRADEPGGIATTYEYQLGSVVRIRSSGEGHDRDDKYSYDARGQVRTANTGEGKHEYGYDATGRVTSIDNTEEWTYDAAGQLRMVTAGSDSYAFAYDQSGHLTQVSNGDESLVASWSKDVLTAVQASGRDAIGLKTDRAGRPVAVSWDKKRAVDVTWATSGDSFTVQQRGKDTAQQYMVVDGTLTGYATDDIQINASEQPNGYLKSITLDGQDDKSGQIRFDQLGRPATLVTDTASTTIGYDTTGRVSSVLTSRPGDDPQQTTITYSNGERRIEGDKEIVDSLFSTDGALRTPLPSSLANPLSSTNSSAEIVGAASVSGIDLLVSPEPNPFDNIWSAIGRATPQVLATVGVRDLPHLAEQMIIAEIARLMPAIRVNGDVSVHVPVVNPKNGSAAAFNPFVDAAPSGLALGLLNKKAGGGGSLLDRAKDTVTDIVGGVVNLAVDTVRFVMSNPISRLIISAGTFALAVAACAPPAVAACVPVAALAVALVAEESAQSLIASIPLALRSCTGGQIAECGLAIASTAVAVGAVFAAVRVGTSIFEIYGARQALSTALSSGEGVAVASGKVGTARSELLAALRFDRVAAREVDVVAAGTKARLDLVTKTVFGRYRLVEVKNGGAARFTANQQIVYPMLQSVGAYFPNGLVNNGSPEMLAASIVQIQHWGTRVPLSLA
ncbi:MAG: DUF6531 domain-containing protein [Actinomycetota bacterium]|nr:DUF6531 domain-containing protein [Actinomycetota bacterium]